MIIMDKLWFPEESGSGGPPHGEAGDVAVLAEETDGETEEEESGEKPGEAEESDSEGGEDDDEEKEISAKGEKDEGDEPTEEDEEEEVSIEERPRLKEITAKYPKLFKEFPALKDAYFRAAAYSELFPSVEDAREAAEKAETLDGFEATLVGKGSSLELLSSIKDTSPVALARFVDNLLPTLYDFDSKLFYRATEPVTRQLLWSAHQHGLKTGDKNLVASTQHLSNYLFEDADVKPPRKRESAQPPSEEIQRFEHEKKQFAERQRSDFVSDLHSRAGRSLVKLVGEGLDPKNVMTQFTRDAITEKVIDEVGRRLESDSRHMARMKSLYTRAQRAGYPKAMTDQITSAYLSAAKALIPGVRSEMKQKALTGKVTAKKVVGNRQIAQSGAGSATSNGRGPSAKQVDWTKTTDEDFLMGKITLKKN